MTGGNTYLTSPSCSSLLHFTYSRPRLPFLSLVVTRRSRDAVRGQSGHLPSGTGPKRGHLEWDSEAEVDDMPPEKKGTRCRRRSGALRCSADFPAHRRELRRRAPPLLNRRPQATGQQLGPTSRANGQQLGPTSRANGSILGPTSQHPNGGRKLRWEQRNESFHTY